MNMACVQFGLTPEEAWAGVTRHAAQALGRQATHGQLKAGFVADFVVWDAHLPVEILYELAATRCINAYSEDNHHESLASRISRALARSR